MAYTTINDPTDYFNTKLYTGTGASNSITGIGFEPDLTWIKSRSVTGSGHRWHDSVRGAGNMIASDSTGAEFDDSALFTSFDTDGFTVAGTGSSYNGSSQTYASWNWLASNTTASNTNGSITSTVSANTTSGFSIVSYTGTGSNATIGHGLGTTPSMIIVKERDNVNNWFVYHSSLGATKQLILQETDAEASFTATWNDTEPTSSVFSVGTNLGTNRSGGGLIAYCFAEKKGYSKFGSYTGNGSTDGPFLYTGFKPAWFMAKRTDSTGNWHMHDNTRDVDNGVTFELRANTTDAEVDVFAVTGEHRADFLSNGIKTRTTGAAVNASGGSYIYMAFAESPFTTSTGVPTTAR
jgi:hypothetical protein